MKTLLILIGTLLTFLISPMALSAESTHSKQTVIILLGAPASGKGTISTRMAKELNMPHISTGDLFRENLKNMTETGKKAKTYMDEGKLVPDNIVLEMLATRIAKPDAKAGYILDGFPRTLVQAEELEKILKEKSNIYVVNLDIKDEVLIKRILERAKASTEKRADDTEEVAKKRLEIYHQESEPLVAYYKKTGQLIITVTEKTSDEVYKDIMSAYYLKQKEQKPVHSY
jgi:adenylate kinase